MRLALTNLDNGLYLESNGRWTAECKLAKNFWDSESVAKAARDNNVKNAAAAIVHGDPPNAMGFFWVTNPN
jgi:hypothetical protein